MNAPPLLVSYTSIEHYLDALEASLRDQHEDAIRFLVTKGLPPVASSKCLATLFGLSTGFITAMSHQNWKYYRTFQIKQGKKKRVIQAPKVSIKVIQKWFGYHLAKAVIFDDFVIGFVEGRSVISAANIHVNAKWVYSVDIEDFFPSTTKEVVKQSLIDLGYSVDASNLIVSLCCYKSNLAQGSPASPVLSNIVMKNIDFNLKAIATKYGIRVSRYADDIVFSGQDDFPQTLKDDVKSIFNNTCWKLSLKKEHFAELPQRLKVHGFLVHQDKPRLTKGYRNKIRAFEYMLKSGKVQEKDVKRLIGHIKYSQSVDKFNNVDDSNNQ